MIENRETIKRFSDIAAGFGASRLLEIGGSDDWDSAVVSGDDGRGINETLSSHSHPPPVSTQHPRHSCG